MFLSTRLRNIAQTVAAKAVTILDIPPGLGERLIIPAGLTSDETRVYVCTEDLNEAKSYVAMHKAVGTQVPANFEVTYPVKEKIVYITRAALLKKALSYSQYSRSLPWVFCDVLMIPVYDGYSSDISLIMALWRVTATKGERVPRLILVTYDWSYDELLAGVDMQEDVGKLKYRPSDFTVTITHTGPSSKPKAGESVRQIAEIILKSQGTIAIYVAGYGEGEAMTSMLRKMLSAKHIIIGAHSIIVDTILEAVVSDNKNKVIVVTDATASILPLDVSVVIDTMLEYTTVMTKHLGTRTILSTISKRRAAARIGRLGTRSEGRAYRMMSQEQYDKLPDVLESELDRLPFHWPMIRTLVTGYDVSELFAGLSDIKLEEATRLLKDLGIISLDGRLTDRGKFVAMFTLGIVPSVILEMWFRAKNPLFPCIVVVSLLDSYEEGYFKYPPATDSRALDAHYAKYFRRYEGYSDVETMINMWHAIMDVGGGIDKVLSEMPKMKTWCANNSIRFGRIKEALHTMSVTTNVLTKELRADVPKGKFTLEGFLAKFRPIVIEVYTVLDRIVKFESQGVYKSVTGMRYMLDYLSVNKFNSSERPPPILLIPLITSSTGKARQSVIHIALDFEEPKKERKRPPVRRDSRSEEQEKKEMAEALKLMEELGM